MLDDCNYNKLRLVHDLSRIIWYLDKHAIDDAEKAGHLECLTLYKNLHKDLELHMQKLIKGIEALAKVGKLK